MRDDSRKWALLFLAIGGGTAIGFVLQVSSKPVLRETIFAAEQLSHYLFLQKIDCFYGIQPELFSWHDQIVGPVCFMVIGCNTFQNKTRS
jgi:hypothetical protein